MLVATAVVSALAVPAIVLRSVFRTGDRQSLPAHTAAQLNVAPIVASISARPVENIMDIKAEELTVAWAVVSDFPNRAEPLSILASVHESHGHVEQAERIWNEVIAMDPSVSYAYERLGILAQERDQLSQAIAYWRQGLEANPRAANLRWHLADVLVLQGHVEGTLELLEAECALTPQAARNYFLLGQIHFRQGRFEQARACYEKTLECQPDYFNAYYGLGRVYARLNQMEKAKESMEIFTRLKAVGEASDDERIPLHELQIARARAAGFYRQAHRFYDSRQHDTIGQRLLERATILDPNDARNWEKLGTHHYRHRRFDAALTIFERARQIDPNNPLFHVNIATLHHWLNRPEQTERLLKEAIDRFPQSDLAHAELARFYLHSRRSLPAAQTLAQRAVALEPSAEHYFVLARACAANGDATHAAWAIEKALALEPADIRYRDFYAQVRLLK